MSEFYENPLCTRYASDEMKRIFSADKKFSTWRKLWIALAESEKELGLPITDGQIAEMKEHIYDIDYAKAAEYEKKLRHDVMAHLHAFCDLCPTARPIVHLGATSCYVGDNTDIIVMKEGLLRIRKLLLNAISALSEFAEKYKNVPTLAYTHFQSAQPTTVGKRATLWLQDLVSDLADLDYRLSGLRLLGCKGTTGTAASFLTLFGGDHAKVKELEKKIAAKMGFEGCYAVSGQTYSRKVDFNVLAVLSGIAQSASKFSSDIRLLSHLKEFDEPFESGQVGSSAMAYKRNPMRSERIASLSRYVIADCMNPAITASAQWFERTLDDSANKRISVPEAFLAIDGVLSLYINIVKGGSVYPKMAERHLKEELPFMATENILMYCVEKGGDRQVLHEAIRRHSVETAKAMKLEGKDNDVLDKIAADRAFGVTREEIDRIIGEFSFTGCACEQTTDYLENCIKPLLAANAGELGLSVEINV
ncbi:MAG: adenylosuccinate lyase [Candidatus Borkfalkiaceae bacterium]|nr:adenylosuccinate lyase [Christensenellaceae bacterium]